MFVKILILGITVILIANEFSHFLDKLSSRTRKVSLFSIVGLLTILSLVDIYNDEQDYNKLKKKTDDIFSVAESVNDMQKENNSNLSESRKEISEIDSELKTISDTLTNQVQLLNQAITKSKDLLSIEKTKLNLERPKISVLSSGVSFSDFFKDESKMAFEIKARNRGKRDGVRVSFGYVLVAFKENTNLKNVFFGDIGMNRIKNLEGNVELTLKSPLKISKTDFDSQYGSGVLVCRFIYSDEIGNEKYDENYFIGLKNVKNVGSVFYTLIDENEEKRAIKYLNQLKLFDYLSKKNSLK